MCSIGQMKTAAFHWRLLPPNGDFGETGYNRVSSVPIHGTREEEIRYRVLCGYLGLIMYTERFYRYKRTQKKYYVNAVGGKKMLSDALRVLETDE